MMTPERRAEIERLNSKNHDSHDWQWHAFNELLAEMHEIDRLTAENARLNKAVDQAITLTHMRRYAITKDPNFICAQKVQMQHVESVPELAAELERQAQTAKTPLRRGEGER